MTFRDVHREGHRDERRAEREERRVEREGHRAEREERRAEDRGIRRAEDRGIRRAEERETRALARGAARGPRGGRENVVACRLDPAALEALDSLVEAGVRSTRSDAAAWLINAGLQANRELLDEVASTVAEIKRLREGAIAKARRFSEPGDPADRDAAGRDADADSDLDADLDDDPAAAQPARESAP